MILCNELSCDVNGPANAAIMHLHAAEPVAVGNGYDEQCNNDAGNVHGNTTTTTLIKAMQMRPVLLIARITCCQQSSAFPMLVLTVSGCYTHALMGWGTYSLGPVGGSCRDLGCLLWIRDYGRGCTKLADSLVSF